MSDLDLSPEAKKVAEESAARFKSLSELEQLIYLAVSAHIRNGAYWGSDNDVRDSLENITNVLREGNNARIATVRQLKNGFFFEVVDFETAYNVAKKVTPEYALPANLKSAKSKYEASLDSIKKFVEDGKSGLVGFYCTNASGTVTSKGVTYPAFNLTLSNFVGAVNAFGKGRYSLKTADGKVFKPDYVQSHQSEFLKGLTKAPNSSNAVMVELVRA